jgi:SAM-dependent methyltransferase
MRPRIFFGRFLIRFGRFIQSLAVMVMKSGDLVEFSRLAYSNPAAWKEWTRKELVDSGLSQDEKNLLSIIPVKKGRLLLLGIGGGREAIPLAKMGFEITGVDFVPSFVQQSKQTLDRHGLTIEGLVQEISKLDVDSDSYDIVWLSSSMYSCIPTKTRRIEMLERIRKALKPGGYLFCQFQYLLTKGFTPRVEFLRKVFASLTFGNLQYETGDMIWRDLEFIHNFSSEKNLLSEFDKGGFQTVKINIPENGIWGSAVLRKPLFRSQNHKNSKQKREKAHAHT